MDIPFLFVGGVVDGWGRGKMKRGGLWWCGGWSGVCGGGRGDGGVGKGKTC